MGLFDLLGDLFYTGRGVHIDLVELEEFEPRLTAVLEAMLSESEIEKTTVNSRSADQTKQQKHDAFVAHMSEKFQPAHNALNDVKLGKPFKKFHRLAMTASRACGEALTSYIKKDRFLADCDKANFRGAFRTNDYHKADRDLKQWNSLALEYTRKFYKEARSIQLLYPQEFDLLVPSEATLEGVQDKWFFSHF